MLLIVDANVLIDYLKVDESILTLCSSALGRVHVPREVLDEVAQADEGMCSRIGLVIVEAETEQLLEAGEVKGRLSFTDHLCLILARDNEWVCVTNDKPLHSHCAQAGVTSMWGLELLIELVSADSLPAGDAVAVATKIAEASGGRVTPKILADFERRVRGDS